MQFVIVTGMSGAGKSTALKFLEDLGFFCVDNLPPSLIPKFAEVCFRSGSEIKQVALGIDIRGGSLFDDFFIELSSISLDYQYQILFLDSTDEILLKRFSETRRTHPLAKNERIILGIEKERELLTDVKQKADFIIDTSMLLTRQLRERLVNLFIDKKDFDSLIVTIISFGFKFGIPTYSDLVFDVRFLPNPFYISELKEQTGNDAPVSNYVLSFDASKDFLNKLIDMITFLLPLYVQEGKNQLVISIGCTGGKHRSVTLANELYKVLNQSGHFVNINHHDINR